MNIFERLRRLKSERAFNKYVSPKVLSDALEATRAGGLPGNEIRHFQFVVVHVEEGKPDEVPKMVADVVDTLIRHQAMISGIESSLVISYLGLPAPKNDSAEVRRNIVAALLSENGNRVHVAHGQCNGLVGLFGSSRRCTYGAVIPNFSTVLKKLLETEFGTAVEIM